MKYITCYYKRLTVTFLKVAILAAFISIFFFPSFTLFKSTGENLFDVIMNGEHVGTVTDVSKIDEYILNARKEIASKDSELVFIDIQTEVAGREAIWGRVDKEEDIEERILSVMNRNIKETTHRSYTVKINEYMVNLSSQDEVKQLLQAAVNKYDKEGKYKVELSYDSNREFSVLTTQIIDMKQVEEAEALESANIYADAGVQLMFNEMFDSVEPAVEKGFEDYELGLIGMNFSEEIEVVESYLPEEELTSIQEAIDYVTKDQEKNTVYEVVSGDTLSEIAIKTNIPMDQIVAMNSNLLSSENSTLHIGDELVITVPEPELSVEWQEEVYLEEEYEADIIYVDRDDWFTNQTQTIQEPSAGFRKIVAIISYSNDKEVGREIVKEEVVMEAVPKIVERGTKIPPTYIKPISGGRLSSGFGNRKKPNAKASSYHKGVDWATPTGTKVVASSGGTVAKAGWLGTYGYVIYINHPDGRQTRYAHLSKILVSVGQTVKQGQQIALSGNTGNSTGPHLHFEILINGKQVNPLKYLP